MPLWMQLLIGGGILQQAADGEGGDLGAGGDEGAPAKTEKDTPPKPEDGGKQEPAKKPASSLTDKEAELLKDVMKQKEAAQKANAELATLRESLGDLDLDLARQLIADKKTAETKALEEKGEYERVKESMATQHATEVERLNGQISALQDALNAKESHVNELTIGTQFSNSAFIQEELVLPPTKARSLYGSHFDLVDGKVVGYDKPRGAADRTEIVDQYGRNLGFDEAMRAIIEADPEKDHLIKSKAKIGAGSLSSPKGGSNNPPPKEMTGQEKIQAGLTQLFNSNKK